MSPTYFRTVLTLVTTVSLIGYSLAGCAADADPDSSSSSSGNTGGATTTSSSQGGATGGSTASGTGGNTGPCGTDCSTIQTPDCQVAQCNVQSGMCEVVNDEDGVSCDDGVFCTISDTCLAGTCTGGPANDCGMAPGQCTEITCDEQSQTCSAAPSANGATCQDPNDLCLQGSTCSNGLCIGGTQNDCFFFPVPSDCHVATCNAMNGMCEAVVGNEGQPCNDPNDLCTVNKTCATGVCVGGDPKNCSQLTQGCVLGVCDVNSGQCVTQNLVNNDPCDDLDACTTGELCNNGSCAGGSPVTACVNNDGCCPSNCTANNDIDCACGLDKLKLSEMNIGTDYVAIFNPTTCVIDIDPLELFFDDSSLSDLIFQLPSYMLAAGGTVYIVEGTASGPDEISTNSNIFFSSTRGGATIMCDGPCSNPANVVDVVAFSEGAPHGPLPSGIIFSPGGLTGIGSESTNSYLRTAYIGQTPNFLAADWTVGPKTN
jgi:hypothetical protein